ncbi:hypothetical protein Tco_0434363 [Tanacetum coccineum]
MAFVHLVRRAKKCIMDFVTLNIDGQSTNVEAPPDIIDVDDDDDFIDDKDGIPHDLAYSNDEVLANDDDDVAATVMSAAVARGHGGDGDGDDPSSPSTSYWHWLSSTWMAFRGNTRDLGSFREETAKPLKDSPNEHSLRTYQRLKKAIYEKALRKSNQMHQTFEKSSLARTHSSDAYDEPIGGLCMMNNKLENPSSQSTLQVLPSFEKYAPPVTYPEEVKETIGVPIEVEPFDQTQLEGVGLNTCNHDVPLSSREVPGFD